jgi:hypothetical protein
MNSSDFTHRFTQWFQPDAIVQLARQTRWLLRQGKIDAFEFFTGLIFGQMSALGLTLRAQSGCYTEPVTRQAVDQRYDQSAVDFFHVGFDRCLQQALADRPGPSLTQELAKHFKAVRLVDSTSFDCPETLDKIYPGCGGKASSANCKILLEYEYVHGQFHPLALLPGNRSDQGLASQLPPLVKPGELLITDKGFSTHKGLKQIDQQEAFFLLPYHRASQVWLPQAEGSPVKLDVAGTLRHTKENVVEWNVYLGDPADGLRVRLVAYRLGEESANRHRAALRRSLEKKGKQPTAVSLELAAWLILITNAPADKLPTSAMSYLYRVRWQIELVFKQCKSILRLDQTKARKNSHRVQCEIWARLIAAVVLFAWHSHLQAALPPGSQREMSFAQVASHIQQMGMTLALWLIAGGQALLDALRQLWRHLLRTALKGRQRTRKTNWELLHEHWLQLAEPT